MTNIVFIDGERFINDNISDKIQYLKQRAEQIMCDDISDGEALQNLYNLICLLPSEDQ